MGLVARAIEAAGVPTVALSNVRGATRRVKPPRSLIVPFPRGETVGPAYAVALQSATVSAALDLLVTAREPGTMRDLIAREQ